MRMYSIRTQSAFYATMCVCVTGFLIEYFPCQLTRLQWLLIWIRSANAFVKPIPTIVVPLEIAIIVNQLGESLAIRGVSGALIEVNVRVLTKFDRIEWDKSRREIRSDSSHHLRERGGPFGSLMASDTLNFDSLFVSRDSTDGDNFLDFR